MSLALRAITISLGSALQSLGFLLAPPQNRVRQAKFVSQFNHADGTVIEWFHNTMTWTIYFNNISYSGSGLRRLLAAL